ncbi:MAG: flagellar filament outer layer protein FlaA [Treponema sp.]|jgi:hypothetical protein|nr:flagellar filament outer layer protein FlaA [Treponema sp.]
MKRYTVVALLLSAGVLFAQEGSDPSRIGIDTAQQNLKEISIDKFEHDSYWHGVISPDDGFITARLFEGSPAPESEENPNGKATIPDEEGLNILDDHVLGVRVDFLHRGHTSFSLYPRRPIPIEGITKTISVWVAGRNYNHTLKILIQDFFGRQFELEVGKLNFQGWKKLTVAIPPQPAIGKSGIVQRDYHYNNQLGIKVVGFKVDCDPSETSGTYYLYLDDLRAVTDLFAENNRDPDDMADAW